jgi:serine/threonine protein phosphatase PrpC
MVTATHPHTPTPPHRSLGDLDFKEPGRYVESEPDVGAVALRPGDAFLVAGSDGLWDVMSDADAVAGVARLLEVRGGGGRVWW